MNDNISDLYADYLLSSFGPATATGLSSSVEGQISHDRITRKLSEKRKTSAHEKFSEDFRINFAVVRALEIIGEATKRLVFVSHGTWYHKYF